jgi:hypothetical protein
MASQIDMRQRETGALLGHFYAALEPDEVRQHLTAHGMRAFEEGPSTSAAMTWARRRVGKGLYPWPFKQRLWPRSKSWWVRQPQPSGPEGGCEPWSGEMWEPSQDHGGRGLRGHPRPSAPALDPARP